MENTLEGFDTAVEAGVWGLEFDIRWTRDLRPVVFHDRDLRRIFNDPRQICEFDRQALGEQFPLIPSLEEVVRRYGRRVHLMIELKAEPYPRPRRQANILADVFTGLEPKRDFHFLTLDAGMFAHVGFAPPSAYLPVAQLNFRTLSRLALSRGYHRPAPCPGAARGRGLPLFGKLAVPRAEPGRGVDIYQSCRGDAARRR